MLLFYKYCSVQNYILYNYIRFLNVQGLWRLQNRESTNLCVSRVNAASCFSSCSAPFLFGVKFVYTYGYWRKSSVYECWRPLTAGFKKFSCSMYIPMTLFPSCSKICPGQFNVILLISGRNGWGGGGENGV